MGEENGPSTAEAQPNGGIDPTSEHPGGEVVYEPPKSEHLNGSNDSSTSTSNIRCLCGAVDFPLDCDLPANTELCHCNPCRYTTGALFGGWANLNSPPPKEVLEKCTVYHSSKTHERYFCSTCGTKLFVHPHHTPNGKERDFWVVFGGAIDPPDGTDQVLNIESNEFVGDAKDGGMAAFMTTLNQKQVACYETDRNSTQFSALRMGDNIRSARLHERPADGAMLKAACHCGGISLLIQKADHQERSISQLDRFIPKDKDGNFEKSRHIAMTCSCRSCRLHTGVSLAPWAYIPPVQIINPHTGKSVVQHRAATTGTAAEYANKGLSLTHYFSSDQSCRSFCNVCGAAVFFSMDKRPEIINVAAGLLRAEEGVMARCWMSWQWGRVSWKEESTQRDVMEAWQATGQAEKRLKFPMVMDR